MAKWMSYSPSKAIGVQEKRGEIAEGKHADLIVWDPEELCSDNPNPDSPFGSQSLRGHIRAVFLRGRLAFNEGTLSAPQGKLLKRLR
jgi:dihydroorotase-like cyclic amidohydrolase